MSAQHEFAAAWDRLSNRDLKAIAVIGRNIKFRGMHRVIAADLKNSKIKFKNVELISINFQFKKKKFTF